MPWTELTRRQHSRTGGKYASDLTDAEWALIAPLMPPLRTTGRPRTTRLRDVFDAILYVATSGYQWRMLPNENGNAKVGHGSGVIISLVARQSG